MLEEADVSAGEIGDAQQEIAAMTRCCTRVCLAMWLCGS